MQLCINTALPFYLSLSLPLSYPIPSQDPPLIYSLHSALLFLLIYAVFSFIFIKSYAK